jgi:HSP20 family molecular chaperone IbpA
MSSVFDLVEHIHPRKSADSILNTLFHPMFDLELLRSPLTQLKKRSDALCLLEEDDLFKASVDLPGVGKDQVEIDVDLPKRVVTVSGERKKEFENGKEYGSFHYSFSLPKEIDDDEEKWKAVMRDGVLYLTFPLAIKKDKASVKLQIE